MKDVSVIVYTMKGCPFCEQFKEILKNENIEYIDRDIHEHKDEHDLFVKATDNELIPSLLVIENMNEFSHAPERNYNDLNEALEIVKKHMEII
jgi:glutaredoxin